MSVSNWKSQTVRFLTAQTISLFGSSLVQYAIVWYITLQTSSGFMLTLGVLCGFIPQLCISLFAGAWLDKYNRKNIMIIADAFIALCTLIVAICFLSGVKEIWILFIALAVRSLGTGIQTPAVNAFIPMIVPKDKLLKVNGINGTLMGITFCLSPALSAVIFGALGIEATLFVDIITAIIGITIMFSVHAIYKGETPLKESTFKSIKSGLAYLKKSHYIRAQIIFTAVVCFLISPTAFLTPLLISRSFGPELWRLSIAEMTYSAGAVIGGLLIANLHRYKNLRKIIVFATAAHAIAILGLGLSPSFVLYSIFNGILGILLPAFNAPTNSAIQERCSPQQLGRIFSLLQIATAGALPAGTLVFGPLADIVSIQSLLILSALLMLIFTVFAWRNKKFMNA